MSTQKPDQKEDHKERLSRPPYKLSEEKEKNGFEKKYEGTCFCGNVQVSLEERFLRVIRVEERDEGWKRRKVQKLIRTGWT